MYLYLLKRAFLKKTIFMVFAAALLSLSCSQPGSSSPCINAQQPVITGEGADDTWDVMNDDTFTLTVTAVSPDQGSLGYQWYSNVTADNNGGAAISEKTSSPDLTLNKTDYASDGGRYFYVVVTDTIGNNGDGGKKTAAAAGAVTTVTVINNQTIHINQSNINKIGVDPGYPLSGTYVLDENIELADWIPIGDEDKPFRGTFDGNGKIVTFTGNSFANEAVSDKTCLGIFGYVKSDSVLANAEIKNINLSGTLDFTTDKIIYMGGIAGVIDGKGTLIRDNNSSLTMNIYPGNTGSMAYSYIGGFTGMFRNGAGIENCHNTGDVSADNTINSAGGQIFVGGIAGGSYYSMKTNYQGYIQGSSSAGTISGRALGDWTFAGGIAGTISGGDSNSVENTTRIERCFAAGTVTVAGTRSAFPYVGGIVGYNYYGALVSQCYFDGDVIGDIITGKEADYTGGIAGYNSQTKAPNNSRIEDCWSGGTVSGFNNAGGIAGQNQINAYIRRCYSTAAVSACSADSGVGGIAGVNASALAGGAISSCVALNLSLSPLSGKNIHRITGTAGGSRSNNYARPGLIPTGSKGVNNADGEDTQEMPDQGFYQDTLGWDFSTVWVMADSNAYPILRWQEAHL